MRGVLLCVQDFDRVLFVTQRNLFSDTGVKMLSETAANSDSNTSNSLYAPWFQVESDSLGQFITDLRTCFEKALDGRRVIKDTSQKCYALGGVRPSSGESSSQ